MVNSYVGMRNYGVLKTNIVILLYYNKTLEYKIKILFKVNLSFTKNIIY